MAGSRKDPTNKTRDDWSLFGKLFYEKFLEKDGIKQSQLAAKTAKIAEKVRDLQLIEGVRKVDAGTISRMMQGTWGHVASGDTLAEQLYTIFKALKEVWKLDIQSNIVQELLQHIPPANLSGTEQGDLITKLIKNGIVTSVYYYTDDYGKPQQLIGRHEDIQNIVSLLRDREIRFVNVVGLPGVGKTTLVQVIEEETKAYFAFVSVESLTKDIDSEYLMQRIRSYPHGEAPNKRALIILDNGEKITDRDNARKALSDHLKESPQLTILAVSTFSLIAQPYILQPLSLPPLGGGLYSPKELQQKFAAVQYFLNKAKVEITEENASDIADLCILLEGLPLSLNLAASWVANLGVDGVYQKWNKETIEDRYFTIERHITLDTAIQYSYGKLNEQEQRLFRRLAIFGGATHEAVIAAICDLGDLFSNSTALENHETSLIALLKTLEMHCFITFADRQVYIYHNFLRDFALRQLQEAEKEQVTTKFIEYYVDRLYEDMAKRYTIGEDGIEIDIDEYLAKGGNNKWGWYNKEPYSLLSDDEVWEEAKRRREIYQREHPLAAYEANNIFAVENIIIERRKKYLRDGRERIRQEYDKAEDIESAWDTLYAERDKIKTLSNQTFYLLSDFFLFEVADVSEDMLYDREARLYGPPTDFWGEPIEKDWTGLLDLDSDPFGFEPYKEDA